MVHAAQLEGLSALHVDCFHTLNEGMMWFSKNEVKCLQVVNNERQIKPSLGSDIAREKDSK